MLNNTPSKNFNFILHLTYLTYISLLINVPDFQSFLIPPYFQEKHFPDRQNARKQAHWIAGGNSLSNEPTHARSGDQEDPVRKTPLISSSPCSWYNVLLRHGDTNDIDTNVHIITHLTHLTTRRGMRRKYKQPYATQSEVTCTHAHLTLTPTS